MKAAKLTRAEAQARAAILDVHSYDVRLDLTGPRGEPVTATFGSRATVRFGCREPGTSTFVDVSAKSLRSVTLNGAAIDPHGYPGDRIVLEDLEPENVLVVEGDFSLSDEYLGLLRSVDPADGEAFLLSMTFMAGAQRIFACFDQPDLKAEFTFHVTAPTRWRVISNGSVAAIEKAANDSQVVRFATTKPIPTYITAVMAGPFHHERDVVAGPGGPIELGLYCPKSAAPHLDAAECFAVTKAGFDLFHQVFGFPYPFGKYDQVFVTEPGYGGMENAGAVALGNGFIFRSRVTDSEHQTLAYTILHELSHMWFGNLVTTRWWDDSWLNEAFATFAGFFSQVEATTRTNAWATLAYDQKLSALKADQMPTTHPISADVPDLHTALSNFDHITYAKGASVLKQLVAYVGREEFDLALRGYFREHAYRNATLTDLFDALEGSSGRDLRTWAAQWLQTSQVNTLAADFTLDDEGSYATFAVCQTAPDDHPTLRNHRIAVGLFGDVHGRLERRRQVGVDVVGARTEVPELVGRPAADFVLVNDEDLTYAKVRFDPDSLRTLHTRIGSVVDPLARTVCWTALWDMVRDGELAAGDWFDIVIRGIGSETEVDVLHGLLRNLEQAVAEYVAPAREGAARLADEAWRSMTSLEPGGDHQLLWSRTFARIAGTTPRGSELRAIYDGERVVDGIDLDFETRWELLHGLVASGLAGQSEIDTEFARDANLTSEHYAATARALVPDTDAKEAAWKLVTADGAAPLSVRGSTAQGFWHPDQAELLRPYVARYYESLDSFWALDDGGHQTYVTTTALAPQLVDPATVDAADQWLARPDRPATQRRMVLEHRDELARAMRNRERDVAAVTARAETAAAGVRGRTARPGR